VSCRADYVGSFLRSAELLQAREKSDGTTLEAIEDKYVLRMLAKQKGAWSRNICRMFAAGTWEPWAPYSLGNIRCSIQ
jgi:hypothetical protein